MRYMKLIKNFKKSEYLKIFLRFPINSLLSFLIRFLSLYFFVDLLSYNYNTIYLTTYFYIMCQSYFVQKFIVQRRSGNNFKKFLLTNIILGFVEYAMIYCLQIFFNYYYSSSLIIAGLVIYFFRFYFYTFKIFNRN
mgnify:CR=1 FL=1